MRARTISGQFSLFSMDAVDICAINAERLRATTLPSAHTAVLGFFNCTSSRAFYTFSCVCCVITENSAGRIVYSIVTSAFSSQLHVICKNMCVSWTPFTSVWAFGFCLQILTHHPAIVYKVSFFPTQQTPNPISLFLSLFYLAIAFYGILLPQRLLSVLSELDCRYVLLSFIYTWSIMFWLQCLMCMLREDGAFFFRAPQIRTSFSSSSLRSIHLLLVVRLVCWCSCYSVSCLSSFFLRYHVYVSFSCCCIFFSVSSPFVSE